MNNVQQSFKNLFQKNSNGITKIILLGFGLSLGLVLISKVYFEQTYENYIEDLDQTYKIISDFESKERGPFSFGSCAGAIAPGIKQYSPQVEFATRFTPMFFNSNIKVIDIEQQQGFASSIKSTKAILADTCFFDIFNNGIVTGETKNSLNTPDQALISLSLAKKIIKEKNDVSALMGKVLVFEDAPKSELTIAGIYNDFPSNSTLHTIDVVISLGAIRKFMGDGSNLWFNNERYQSYIKLSKGAKAEDIEECFAKMCKEKLPHEQIEKSGLKVSFHITPIAQIHVQDKDVKRTCIMLLILAFTVLTVTTLNYILISTSALVKRSKIFALHKCYGANRYQIFKILLSDAFICLILSLVLSTFFIFSLQDTIKDLLGTKILALVTPKSIAIMFFLCAVILFICGLLPGYTYSKIPVTSIFRKYCENNRKWKHGLLLAQFICTSFFITLLAVTGIQYRHMINLDTNYSYDNVASAVVRKLNPSERNRLQTEISKLPFVKEQSFSSVMPIHPIQLSDVKLSENGESLFLANDMLSTENEYFSILDIPIIEGRMFNEQSTSCEALISRQFSENLLMATNWNDGVIGKQIYIYGHSPSTICGIYEDYHIGDANSDQNRASIHFNTKTEVGGFKNFINYYMVKLEPLTSSNIATVNNKIKELFPNIELEITPYSYEFESAYKESKKFRNLVLISGFIVLIITLIGLIGYSKDEINRRRSEVAIRKINGASILELLGLFSKKITINAAIGIAIGIVGSFFVASKWLEQFPSKIDLSLWIFLACALFTLLAIISAVVATTYKAANTNPINNLTVE